MWSAWDEWSSCSKTCDGGEKQRYRTCTNPKPKPSGRDCYGRNWEDEYCNQDACPVTSRSSINLLVKSKLKLIMLMKSTCIIRFAHFL